MHRSSLIRSARRFRWLLSVLLLSAAAVHTLAQGGKSLGYADPLETASAPDEAVSLRVEVHPASARPGDEVTVAVIVDHAPGYHTWPALGVELPAELAEFAIRSSVELSGKPAWIERVVGVQQPETKVYAVPNTATGEGTLDARMYSGRSVWFLVLQTAKSAAPGSQELALQVKFQACDDATCLQPQSRTLHAPVTLSAAPAPAGERPEVFAGLDRTKLLELSPTAASARTFFGIRIPTGFVMVAVFAAIGGFVLNLTPCVLPVIPIKILTISKQAGSPARTMTLGLWMAGGVVFFWFALGVLAASFTSWADPSRLFGIWYVTLGIGLLIAFMALGIMGLFNINLPQSVYLINPKADSPWGSFLFGIMTAVLGLPCFGFVAGALLAGSATMPATTILTIFTALGVGMAAPYLVLSARPSLLSALPKAGPASDLVKQVMGLLLLAAGAFFIGSGVLAFIGGRPEMALAMPWWAKQVHWWVIAVLAVAAGAWLAYRTFQITPSGGKRLTFAVVGLIIGGVATLFAVDSTRRGASEYWKPYSRAGFVAARDAGNVVVVDFTATWCINCQLLKATVLSLPDVKARLKSPDVVPLLADLTSDAAPGWKFLDDLKQTGIPALAIFGPGLQEPIIHNAYTPAMVLEAIERAAGKPSASALPSGR